MRSVAKRKKLRIAINGLGRIGRTFLRLAWGNPALEIVAANSLSAAPVYAHLLKYDSIYGHWDRLVRAAGNKLVIDGKPLVFFQIPSGGKLPWSKVKPDLVIDATGHYRGRQEALSHLKAGARYVLVTAPAGDLDATLVMGVNEDRFDPKKHRAISAASCTSVCAALVVKVIEEKFGIERGVINTIHAFTNDQNLHDSAHSDLRRARAATQSIIPTTSGVSKTLQIFFPKLKGKFSAQSFRVPVIDSSLLNLVLELKRKTASQELNRAFTAASKRELHGHLAVTQLPLVSNDFKQDPHGATVDLLSTKVVDGRLANIVAWYANEWGYVSQVVKLLEGLAKKI